MGLKEAEWVISSNHNKGRVLGPSRLGASEEELLCWKIKSLSLCLSTQTVSLIPTVGLLFINERHGNMDLWSTVRMGGGGPKLAMGACLRYYPIRKQIR